MSEREVEARGSEAVEPEASEDGEARAGSEAVEPEASEDGEAKAGSEAVEPEASEDGEAKAGSDAAATEGGEAEAKGEEKKPGKLQQLILEYGVIALIVHLTLFALTISGFAVAISAGWETDGAGEQTGVWVAAYVASQLTKPIRLPLVVVLTPIVAAGWHRLRGKPPKGEASKADADAETDAQS